MTLNVGYNPVDLSRFPMGESSTSELIRTGWAPTPSWKHPAWKMVLHWAQIVSTNWWLFQTIRNQFPFAGQVGFQYFSIFYIIANDTLVSSTVTAEPTTVIHGWISAGSDQEIPAQPGRFRGMEAGWYIRSHRGWLVNLLNCFSTGGCARRRGCAPHCAGGNQCSVVSDLLGTNVESKMGKFWLGK